MKKPLSLLLAIFISFSLSAQLKVHQSGNVGIKTTSEAQSPLVVGENAGDEFTAITATGEACGAYFIGNSTCNFGLYTSAEDEWSYGLRSDVLVKRKVAAIDGRAILFLPTNNYTAVGVRGIAGNAGPGYNFGVFGLLSGTNGGAGVYGTSDATDWGNNIGYGRYAGYFNGNVRVTGYISATSVTTTSDVRYKKNIQSLSSQPNALNLLSELNPVTYNLKQPEKLSKMDQMSDTTEVARPYFDEESQEFQKQHYGLIAQELQTVMPDLVYENADGLLSVNYIELIPVLIQAVKEQQQQIEVLTKMVQAGNGGTIRQLSSGVENEEETYLVASLEQNRPNPFNEKTTIEFTLPENVVNAALYIYDLNGRQIDKIDITARGKSSVEIPGNRLPEGMYIYTLLADNAVVGSKRMILTK